MSKTKAVKHEISEKTSKNSLQQYLHEISQIPMLTEEEEEKLLQSISKGDQEARQKLVTSNLRFAVNIAKHYQGSGLSLPDLINEANIGLIEASRRFDPSKGVKFISYAVWWIRQAIMLALAEQAGVVRLPIRQAGVMHRIGAKYAELLQSFGREPKPEEVAEELDLPKEQIEDILRVYRGSISLETPKISNDEHIIIPELEDKKQVAADQLITEAAFQRYFREVLDALTEREKEVLMARFGLYGKEPETLISISKRLNISRERVRQIEEKAKIHFKNITMKTSKLKDYLN